MFRNTKRPMTIFILRYLTMERSHCRHVTRQLHIIERFGKCLTREAFAKSLYDMQLAGDMAAMRALHSQITQDKNSHWAFRVSKHINRQWRLDQIEKVMADPMTIRLHTIKHGDLASAIKAFNEFPLAGFLTGSPSMSGVNVTTTVPEGQTSQVFGQSPLQADVIAGLQLLNARPDYQAYIKLQQEHKTQSVAPVSIPTSTTNTAQGSTTASTAQP